MKGRGKTLYISTFSRIFHAFWARGIIFTFLHWTPKLCMTPAHPGADWFEHKIIDLGFIV